MPTGFKSDAIDGAVNLGFTDNLTAAQVKEAARAALGSTAQSAAIARNELAELSSVFEAAYVIAPAPTS